MFLFWVFILLFVIKRSLCNCMLYESRSGAHQCTQDTRPTAIVRKHKKKLWRLIVTSVKIVNCGPKTLPIALSMPPEAAPASMRTELAINMQTFSVDNTQLRRCTQCVNTYRKGRKGLHLFKKKNLFIRLSFSFVNFTCRLYLSYATACCKVSCIF